MFVLSPSFGQTILPLWDDFVPNQVPTNEKEKIENRDIIRIRNVQIPTLEIFIPAKKTATGKSCHYLPWGRL
jgi:hypothetical protein